jgi:hypothetical protein
MLFKLKYFILAPRLLAGTFRALGVLGPTLRRLALALLLGLLARLERGLALLLLERFGSPLHW